ncbi:hypothetical protein CF326_g2537 [Tilletia indica]|nr:hypothetical protein CF326_g2537 [Tilletia indica]
MATPAVKELMGFGFDDSQSIIEQHPHRRRVGFELLIELDVLPDCPQKILQLFRQLENYTNTCNGVINDGAHLGFLILELSESTALFRREGRWFVQRALDLFKLVAVEEEAAGIWDIPGRLSSLCLQSLTDDMAAFYSQISKYHGLSTVQRGRVRDEYQRDVRSKIQQQKRSILAFKTHFGLNGKLRQIASAQNSTQAVSATSLQLIQKLFDKEHSSACSMLDYQPICKVPSFPRITLLLDLSDLLQIIEDTKAQKYVQRGGKRERESSTSSHDQGSAPQSVPLAPEGGQSFAVLLRHELEEDKLRFQDFQELEEFREQTKNDLKTSLSVLRSRLGTLSAENAALVLQYLSVLCARATLFGPAVSFAELLVVIFREAEDRAPSIKNKIVLATAHGFLSGLLTFTRRKFEAVRAAEEGLRILLPLVKSYPGHCSRPLAILKIVNARALVEHSNDITEAHIQVSALQKAYRISGEAVRILQQPPSTLSTTSDVLRSAAGALLAQSSAARTLIGVLFKYAGVTRIDCFRPLNDVQTRAEEEKPTECRICERNGSPSPLFDDPLHDVIKKLSRDIIETFVKTLDQCVEMSRALVARYSHLHEPLLAEALLLRAELVSICSRHAIDAFAEPAALFKELSKAFPAQFDAPSERAYTGLAQRQRWEADLDGAAASYQIALQHLLSQLDPGPYHQSSLERRRCAERTFKVYTDRTLLNIQLERYEEGLIDINQMSTLLRKEEEKEPSKFIGSTVMKGCCHWMLGQQEEAFKVLTASIQLIKNLQDTKNAKAAVKECDLGTLRFDVAKDKLEHCLALAWYGAVQSSMGNHEVALENGERAVRALRSRLSDIRVQLDSMVNLNPVDRFLPHCLILTAGTLLCMGRREAARKQVEESLKLNSDAKVDGPTVKTALLLKARLLEETTGRGHFEEAARIREEAKKIPFRGFLHRMGCSLGQTRLSRRNSFSK